MKLLKGAILILITILGSGLVYYQVVNPELSFKESFEALWLCYLSIAMALIIITFKR